ncbi:ATP-binding protein [Streptomyces sp. TRM 70361]|uniref:ATP-binding protein n=1 Tax=Streptomyces sp. TRM 70361 TaxID=3116553 RepID=UPI002E7AE4B0|nr:ATP-binding protein [Streptomyces sp. TRM 70361]MEE1942143.1 ATP-binding protein [Streptomyces sp. TRM 70361]
MRTCGDTSAEVSASTGTGAADTAVPGSGTVRPRPYEGTWRFTAPVRDSSVPRARRTVRDVIGRAGVPVPGELMHALLLVLTELVTNAVRHAALLSPEVGVEIRVGADQVRVGVEDGHPYRPAALAADPAHEHTGGRGLLLVRAVTAEAGGSCGVERTASGGKVVWAVLPLPPLPSGPSPAR